MESITSLKDGVFCGGQAITSRTALLTKSRYTIGRSPPPKYVGWDSLRAHISLINSGAEQSTAAAQKAKLGEQTGPDATSVRRWTRQPTCGSLHSANIEPKCDYLENGADCRGVRPSGPSSVTPPGRSLLTTMHRARSFQARGCCSLAAE